MAPRMLRCLTLQGGCTSCEGLDDAKEYARVRSALKILMFSDSENWDLSKLLAAVLHLGNVQFMGNAPRNLHLVGGTGQQEENLLEFHVKSLPRSRGLTHPGKIY